MWRYTYPDEVKHAWGEQEDHKYIARVPIKNPKNPKQQYRYFYTKEAYQAYLRGEDAAKKNPNVDQAKNILSDIKKMFDKPKETKPAVKMEPDKAVAAGKEAVDKTEKGLITMFIPASVVSVGMELVGRVVETVGDKVRELFGGSDNKRPATTVHNPEAISDKLKDPDERADYEKRLEYQANEPDFMKDIPDIPADEVYTKFEDQNEINEVIDIYDPASTTNCANCSAAYELRRRGYDVEAKLNDDSYNGKDSRVYDYFEGAEIIGVNADGSSFVHNEDFVRKLWDEELTELDCLTNQESYEHYAKSQSYTSESIEKAILDNNPPGSRGFIDVCWTEGGGHSIVYEVDSAGKVTIRDSQTYDEYSVDELASKVSQVLITRTDHLELKPAITNAVKPNKKKDRKYYRDQDQWYYY